MKMSELLLTPASIIIICLGMGLSAFSGFVILKPSTIYWQPLSVGLFFAFTIPAFIALYKTVNKKIRDK